MLDPFTVEADRIERFGFTADRTVEQNPASKRRYWIPIIKEVIPNTAAAKGGLKPGERVLKSDGESALGGIVLEEHKWDRLWRKKHDEARSGKEVKWVLEIQTADLQHTRTVMLTVPSSPPRWGSSVWQAPLGRAPAVVKEEGLLAARAGDILNHGVWSMFEQSLAHSLGLPATRSNPLVGFHWNVTLPPNSKAGRLHQMFVSQQQGRTEIILSVRSPWNGRAPARWYLTTPTGFLERAWGSKGNAGEKTKSEEIPAGEAQVGFQAEVDFWLKEVGKVSPRWPLEAKSHGSDRVMNPKK